MNIRLENVTYQYMKNTPYEKKALDNVCLEINEGDFLGVIGHTGSGKTTLIQHLNALLIPDSGSLYIDGELFRKEQAKELRKKVGLVFQYPEYQLFEETVYKDILFGIRHLELGKEEEQNRVLNALMMVGLKEDILDKSVFDLSGGQKRRVAIAGVLIMEPSVLVLDEPAAGLDPEGRENLYSLIKELHRKQGMTIVFVSHSMEDIAKLANRVIVMNDSKVYLEGTVKEVFSKEDKLKEVDLDIPIVTKLMKLLNKHNPEVNKDIFTIEDAKNALLSLMEVEKC